MITIGMNPILFSIGHFAVRWYSLMVFLAAVVGVVWSWRAARKAGVKTDYIFTIAAWGIPGGIVGSRLIHVLDQSNYYFANPGAIIGGEGEAITGAVLVGTLAAWIGSRVHRLPFGRLADLAAPGLILAQFVGRIGCTINGDAYGTPTDLPWGLVYTHPNSYAYGLGVATHPAVWYEMAWDLVVLGILLKLRGRLQPNGSLFMTYLAVYAFGRFFIDFFRVGQAGFLGLHQAQVISLLVLAVTIPILAGRARWLKSLPPASPEATP